MPVTYGGKTYSDEEVAKILQQAPEEDVKKFLANVDDNTRQAIVESYNKATGTNFNINQVNQWAGVSTTPTINTLQPVNNTNIQPTSSLTTTNTSVNTQMQQPYNIKVDYSSSEPVFKYNNNTYSPQQVVDFMKSIKPEELWNIVGNSTTSIQDWVNATNAALGTNYTTEDFYKYVGKTPPAKQPTQQNIPYGSTKLKFLADKYKTNIATLYNNAKDYLTAWNNMTYDQKQAAADNLSKATGMPLTVGELEQDIMLLNGVNTGQTNDVGIGKQLGGGYGDGTGIGGKGVGKGLMAQAGAGTTGEPNNWGATGDYIYKTINGQTYAIPVLKDYPYVDTSWMTNPEITPTTINTPNSFEAKTAEVAKIPEYLNPEQMKQDIYEGIKAQVEAEKQQALEQSNAQFSKLGLFRSGANLKNQALIEQKAMQALAEGYGKAATDIAQLQTQMAMKQADIETQTNLQNMIQQNDMAIKQYLAKADMAMKQGDMDMATKFQNAANILQYQNLISSVQLDNLKNATQLYGIDSNKIMQYDMAALDYMKSMNLAQMDTMTRLNQVAYQYGAEIVKQAVANKHYDQAEKLSSTFLDPLLTSMLPSLIEFTGGQADAETLQQAYKAMYGIDVEINKVEDIIEKANDIYKKLNEKQTYLETYDISGG